MRTVVSIGILMDFSFISSLLWNPPPIITRQEYYASATLRTQVIELG
jgi:hypothetical protein